ncbi:MAG: O-antigen ligase family protein [Saprospiraceae bacterium]|nr:O-antigen ligase family protein [Saprospiraceae bacterium]
MALGAVSPFFSAIATMYGILVTLYFFFQIFQSKNQNGAAHKAAIYIASLEVWLRMNGASLPWEFGKIGCITFLLLGMLIERRKDSNPIYFLLLFLFVPALLISAPGNLREFREFITFQLGGTVLLIISLMYFSKRKIPLSHFADLLRYALLPIITTLVYIIIRSPSIRDIEFSTGANFAASAGFGPNQVSTILGLGILIIGFVYLWKLPPLISRNVDLVFLAILIVRALLTFSRGGVVVAFSILILGYLTTLIYQRRLSFNKFFSFFLLGGIVFGIFSFVNQLTDNALLQRFRGKPPSSIRNSERERAAEISSGRSEIVRTDIEMFLDYPIFGVGLGVSNQLRPEYGYKNISHIEQTRLLAEHGLPGLIFLLFIICLPLYTFFSRRGLNQSIVLIFTLLSFLTMSHSATRLAVVGLYFGFAFIKVYLENYPLHRQ